MGNQNLLEYHLAHKWENSGLELSDFPKFKRLVFTGLGLESRSPDLQPVLTVVPDYSSTCLASFIRGVLRERELARVRTPGICWQRCLFAQLHRTSQPSILCKESQTKLSLRLVRALAFCSLPLFCSSLFWGSSSLVHSCVKLNHSGENWVIRTRSNQKIRFEALILPWPFLSNPMVFSIISAVAQGI